MSFNITPPRKDAKISREGWRHPKTKELIKIVKFTQEEVDWYNGVGASKEGFPEDPAVGKEVIDPYVPATTPVEVETLPEGGDLSDVPVEQTATEAELKEILDQEVGNQPE